MVYTRPLKKDLMRFHFLKNSAEGKVYRKVRTHLATSYSPPVIECSLKLNGVVCVTVP